MCIYIERKRCVCVCFSPSESVRVYCGWSKFGLLGPDNPS